MALDLVMKADKPGQLFLRSSGVASTVASMKDLTTGDKIQHVDGTVETVVSREVTPEGFVIVRTVAGGGSA